MWLRKLSRLSNITNPFAQEFVHEAATLISSQESHAMTLLKSPPAMPDAVADKYAATISGSSLRK